MLKHLQLQRFTAFEQADLQFSPGLNVLIGENGTGKTHLLKLLYAACCASDPAESFARKLVAVFRPHDNEIGRLASRPNYNDQTIITIDSNDCRLSTNFQPNTRHHRVVQTIGGNNWQNMPINCCYIHANNIMAQAPGFLSLYSQREIEFEESYRDLLDRVYRPPLRKQNPVLMPIRTALTRALGGQPVIHGESFFLSGPNGEQEFHLLADGLKPLALLLLLLQNGTITTNSILMWDEPATSLNPKLMPLVANTLANLAKQGTQIFCSTHSLFLLRELELTAQPEYSCFISLSRNQDGTLQAHQAATPSDLPAITALNEELLQSDRYLADS